MYIRTHMHFRPDFSVVIFEALPLRVAQLRGVRAQAMLLRVSPAFPGRPGRARH
jgi:hypothetical protein